MSSFEASIIFEPAEALLKMLKPNHSEQIKKSS